jgi:hypothetical protein
LRSHFGERVAQALHQLVGGDHAGRQGDAGRRQLVRDPGVAGVEQMELAVSGIEAAIRIEAGGDKCGPATGRTVEGGVEGGAEPVEPRGRHRHGQHLDVGSGRLRRGVASGQVHDRR